jgi:membrane associated rhomboid family serine protease
VLGVGCGLGSSLSGFIVFGSGTPLLRSSDRPMTPWVTRILVANVLVFVVIPYGSVPYRLLTLFPPGVIGVDQYLFPAVPFRPWTVFTYMFLHAGFMHLLFNMVGVFFFGPRLEARLGAKAFLGLYFLSGLGGAVFSFLFSYGAPVVGASAAVYGIVIGFAMYWPRELIYIYGVIPVQARWLAAFVVAISLYSGISGSDGGTAHFAHLGGLAVGAGYLRWRDWHTGKGRREFEQKVHRTPSMDGSERDVRRRWATIDLASLHDLNRNEVEELLARVDRGGMSDLTLEERRFLDRMSGG